MHNRIAYINIEIFSEKGGKNMLNIGSFLASSGERAVAVVVGVLSIIFLLGAILFIWWVDTKKRPFKEFWKIVGDRFSRFWGDVYGLFHFGGSVKTVYSDKTLNYSGTEFLPIPTKAPTNQYTYEFVGWDKNGIDENGNVVVRAIYLQKVTVCKINVFDADKSTLLGSYNIEYGSGLNLSDLKPHKNDTKEFTYEFVGWDKNLDAFYGNENVYAVYNAIPKKYNYKFLEDDGETVVSEGNAIYGTPIVAPTAPTKAPTDKGLFEFAGWRGYELNTILTKDMVFYATYDFKPFGGVGTSSIIKTDGNKVKVVEETKLTPEEDSDHEEIKKNINAEAVSFDAQKGEEKHPVTEIKMGQTGVIRKRNGGFVQMNNTAESRVEKFKKINTGLETANTDKDVHQKIQLMTVKKSTEVEPTVYEEQKVITIKPKKEAITENDILNNIMMNKIKIEKKGSAVPDKPETPAKKPRAPKTNPGTVINKTEKPSTSNLADEDKK